MLVLGIDPGTNITGYGLIKEEGGKLIHIESGVICSERKSGLAQKLRKICQGLEEIINKYKPQAVSIEDIFYHKNFRSALKLGQARGAAIVATGNQNLELFEYSPLAVKQAVVGYGRASKDQVGEMVKRILRIEGPSLADTTDALALAICHLNSYKMRRFLNDR